MVMSHYLEQFSFYFLNQFRINRKGINDKLVCVQGWDGRDIPPLAGFQQVLDVNQLLGQLLQPCRHLDLLLLDDKDFLVELALHLVNLAQQSVQLGRLLRRLDGLVALEVRVDFPLEVSHVLLGLVDLLYQSWVLLALFWFP